MRRDDLVNLDIRISSDGPGRYAVDLKIGEREFPTGTLGQAVLDGEADEGTRLFRALVADVALRSAWDQAGALHPRRRIRLRIDDDAPELHALAWETLHDPSPAAAVRSLAVDLDTPFSRYVVSPWDPLGPAPAPIRVLIAVAAPTGLESYDLAPIDHAAEVATVTDALERAPAGLVQHTTLSGPCSLPALVAELERGYHVLHLVAHGAVSADRTGSVVFLEKPEGGIERVDAARFARAIDCLHRSLRLVLLMSCNTATRSPTDSRFGFAPALLGAGVPAVLAMPRGRRTSRHAVRPRGRRTSKRAGRPRRVVRLRGRRTSRPRRAASVGGRRTSRPRRAASVGGRRTSKRAGGPRRAASVGGRRTSKRAGRPRRTVSVGGRRRSLRAARRAMSPSGRRGSPRRRVGGVLRPVASKKSPLRTRLNRQTWSGRNSANRSATCRSSTASAGAWRRSRATRTTR